MITFGRLVEAMQVEKDIGSPDESKAIQVVRAGLNIRPDFWDDFLNVIGNADGVAELLDVPKIKITAWGSRVRDVLDQVSKSDDEESKEDKSKALPTGSGDQIADPDGENTATDLRPTP